jgi:tetratricopeptide (TPR) repeat protein
VIEALCDRALVERVDGEYKLHPLIREEAVERLRNSEDWETANRRAAEFWTDSVETVETVQDAIIAHEAYYHYSAIGNFDACCQVIVKIREGEGWNKLETLGRAYYRLGLADRMIISILDLSKIFDLSNIFCGPEIYNVLGAMYWVKGEINMAIKYFNRARKTSIKYNNNDMLANSLLNLGLCQLDIEEVGESLEIFKDYAKLSKDYRLSYHLPIAYFCLAFLNAKLGQKDAAKKSLENFEYTANYKRKSTPWDKSYSFLFRADTLKLIGLSESSSWFYKRALNFSIYEYHYPLVEALALMGIGELERTRKKFHKSINFHNQSIKILQKIDSQCKLAEAYYQLALTYQAMDDRPNSQLYFQKALTLWERIDAPKQIQRVRQSMKSGRVSDSGGLEL